MVDTTGDKHVRYGISVPDATGADNTDIYKGEAEPPWAGAGEEEDLQR